MSGNGRGQLLKHQANGVYTPTTEPRAPKWGLLLTASAFAMTIGTAIPAGYNIGVINSPADYIKAWCKDMVSQRYGADLSKEEVDTLWAWVVSIFLVGGCIGSLIAATLADKCGRKGSLLICAILFVIGAVFFYFCVIFNSLELLFLGRLIVGLSSGVTTAVVGMYLAEIAPSELRGTLAVFSGMGVTAGVVVAQVASLEQVLGTKDQWHYALSAYVVLVIICFIPYRWYPESPKYLYIVADQRDLARNEIMRLRAGANCHDLLNRVNAELDAMEHDASVQTESRTIWSVLTDKTLLLPVVLVCALQGGQQLSGVNAVFYFSVKIFESSGLSTEDAKWATLGVGCVNLLVACAGPVVMKKINRRPIALYSCLFSGVFLVVLTVVYKHSSEVSWFPKACVVAIFGYIIAYQIGLGPIPYFIGTELFETPTRPAAMALGSLASWACNFYIGMTFEALHRVLSAFVFLPFAAVCFLLVALLFVYLPETRGKEPADVAPLVSNGFRSRRY